MRGRTPAGLSGLARRGTFGRCENAGAKRAGKVGQAARDPQLPDTGRADNRRSGGLCYEPRADRRVQRSVRDVHGVASMKPITLAGFEDKFAENVDPWLTFDDADEALKRAAILHAMGRGPWGRVIELAAGNGSNSAAIAPRALRLDATEATGSGTALVANAIRPFGKRARAIRLTAPARLPRERYDIVLIAEVLYYLAPRAMVETARQITSSLRPGGMLVLAHHRIDFPDFAQHAVHLQRRFLMATRRRWRVRIVRRTRQWIVLSCQMLSRSVRASR